MKVPASRRAVLAGLGALPLAGAARTGPAEAEPIAAEIRLIALLSRYRAAAAVLNDPDQPDESGDGAFGEMMGAVEASAELAPSCRTLTGATVALEWGRLLFLDHVEQGAGAVDHLDVLTLRFFDAALGVLRSTAAGGQAHA